MPKNKPVIYGAESIDSLIPRADPPKTKAPKYFSTFNDKVKTDIKNSKAAKKTLGPSKLPLSKPTDFLKKSSRELPDIKKYSPDHRIKAQRKEQLPKEHGKIPPHTNKDFIKKNAIEQITSIPTHPKEIYCDTKTGNKNLLETSGLKPIYTNKSDFGKVPQYLVDKKAYEAAVKEEHEKYMAEVIRAKSLDQISDQEREATLNALKEKWDRVHEEFQGLSVVTDTLSKKRYKERLEGEMMVLEKDISLLSKHDKIFLAKPSQIM